MKKISKKSAKKVIPVKNVNIEPKKIAASIFMANVISAVVPYNVFASEISGFNQTSGTFNITADKISGQTGFRQYDNFKLTQGDIANLQFIKNSREYSKFVNLVDNQVNINGIVNTMKGNNFYNGHAVFVSPNGIVVGSSGVLNVGSFSAITPSQSTYNAFKDSYIENNLSGYEFGKDNYKGLITNSTGNVIINGKIIARDEVNLYGKNITVQNAGIIAGVQSNNNVITSNNQAETLFNNLVKTNITNAKSFNLVNGKIVLEAGESEADINDTKITVDNSKIAANDIDIHSNANTSLTFDPSHFDFNNAAWGVADKAETKIDVKNSQISAEDISVNANAKNETTQNINLLTPTIVNWIADDDAKISEYFSSSPYTGFDGARANATVNITSSNISAKNDMAIETNAEADLNVNSDLLGQAVPVFVHGLGTETNSNVNVKNSTLNAENDINISAISQSEEETEIKNGSFFSLGVTDALAFAMLNNNIVSDTKVNIDNSNINANSLEVKAIGLHKSEVEIEESANIDKNDFSTPPKDGQPGKQGSGASMGIVMNHVQTNSEVKIKNGTKIKTEEDVRLLSQNLNSIKNKVENGIDGGDDAEGDNDNKSAYEKFQDKIGKVNEYTNKTLLSFFNDKDKLNGEMDEAAFQFSGSAVYNNSNNTAKTNVDGSKIKAGNVTLQTNIVDLTGNSAKAEATEETKFGAGMAVIINEQNNTTVSDINNSEITAGALTVDATTQLPMNPMELTFGKEDTPIADAELKIGISLDEDENGDLDWDKILPDPSEWSPGINFGASVGDWFDKPEFELDGLFNNFAQASGTANSLGIAGSVVYNSVKNNTTASVTGNSDVSITEGNAVLNAANLVAGYNAVGMVDFLIQLANDLGEYSPSQGGGKVGVGGSVLIDNYTNNAASKIENSYIIAENGNINLTSASKQNYITAALTGGTAETFALEGTVHVQNLDGETNSYIQNSETEAENISVKAGEGKISAKKSGDLELDEDTNELSVGEERIIKDKILNVIAIGAFAKQDEEAENAGSSSSSGGAVGATVNVSNIENELNAYIDNSTVTVDDEADVTAFHEQLSVDVLGSAAFAGGVKVKKADQESVNTGEQQEGQKTKNVGNWMDMVDAAGDDEEDVMNLRDLFNENDASKQAQTSVKENKDAVNTADKNVDKDGNAAPSAGESSSSGDEEPAPAANEKSNAETLTNNENKKLEGDTNKKADTQTASKNMSIAAAGAVNVTNRATKVNSKIKNSTVNVGKKLNVNAEQENLSVNVNGGIAKAGNVGAGAGVGIYRDKSETNAIIGDDNKKTKINFTKAIDEKLLNVNADNKNKMINVTAGIGVASNQENGTAAAVGGSFNYNALKEQTNAIIKNTDIKNSANINNDINIGIIAQDNSEVWNAAGGISATQGGSSAYGAGMGANVNYSNKTVNAELNNSNLDNVKDVKINADLKQKYNSIAVAGALASGAESSYTFDGAVNTELNAGKITAKAKNTNITSSGDVEITANETTDNQSLAGALDMSASSSGFGVGIGAVVNVNNSEVTAEADNLTVEKSNSIKINAEETEDLKFLAANMGLQFGGANTVNVNGISNVFVSDVEAQVIGNSVLNSTGNVGINSVYTNESEGITIAGAASMEGSAVGANLIANVYNNHVTSKLDKNSKISADGDVSINARASEDINIIPVGVALSMSGSASVAANINANVIVDTINAQVNGKIENSGSVLVNAQDTTSIISRGGTLALSNSGSAIGGNVNVDVLDKEVKAEIKDTTVNSTGEVDVLATSINSFGGTKKDDGTYDVASIDDAKKFTEKDGDNYKQVEENSDFKNWNMFYDLSASFKTSVSGAIVVKVVDDAVKAYVTNSAVKADKLNVQAKDYTISNAIIGRISYGGTASVGANVFVLAGNSDVQAQIKDGSKLDIEKAMSVVSNSTKKSTLITVGGGAAGTASVNGSAVANAINDIVTSKIDNDITVETGSLDVIAQSDNDLKGLVVNASAAGTAAVGAVTYINEENAVTKAQIGDENKQNTEINAKNDVTVKSTADDSFEALIVNVAAAGTAGIGGMGVLNIVDSTVNSGVYNSTVTSEHGKVEVIADRGFNREDDKPGENIFRSWFKDTSAYKKKGTADEDGKSETEAEGIGEKDIEKLIPKVGVLSVTGAGTAAVAATVISNVMDGVITAEVKNSTVSSEQGLNVQAQQNFTNFDAVAALGAAGNAAINATGVINVLENDVTAKLDNTKIEKGGANVDAKSVMELNQVVVSGQGAGVGAAIGLVVDVNTVDDNVHALVTNGSEIKDGTTVNAEHAIEINNIMLGASVAGTGFAGSFIPVINNFEGETIAKIDGNSNVNAGTVSINANDYIDNFSAIAGISGAGIGASVNGFVISNNYDNTVEAGIQNLVLNTDNNINLNSSSVIDSENALLSLAITGVGAGAGINVVVNSIDSNVSSYIDNTVIEKAGDITLTANKDKQDNIYSLTGSSGVAGIGGAVNSNSIYNLYNNTTQSYVQNTDIEEADNLTVEAHGDKLFTTNNYGSSAAGIGAGVQVNSIVNQVDSTTKAFVNANYIDEKGIAKDINVNNEINVTADDKIVSTTDMGFIGIAGLGAGAGANVNVSNYNEAVIAEILTGENNKINAENVNANSNVTYALNNTMTGVAMGIGAIAGDVSIVQLGKREAIDVETSQESDDNKGKSGINKSLKETKSVYDKVSDDNKYNLETAASDKTGAIARIDGNIETKGDIELNAKTKLNGVKKDEDGKLTLTDTLTFSNENIMVGGIAAGVGVKLTDFSNNTHAEIAGGNITSEGDITLNAESFNNIKMTNNQYTAAAGTITGAVGIYDNKSLTNAKIANANVEANNVNINAKSSNTADISSEAVTLALASANVTISDAIDKNITNASVEGDTNITTTENLNIHSTATSEMAAKLQTATVSGVSLSVLSNNVTENSEINALIKDVNGVITTEGLNIKADTDKLSVIAKTNGTTIAGYNATLTGSGANMTAKLNAGIDSLKQDESKKGLIVNNNGQTIITSGVKASDNEQAADISANAYIENNGFSLYSANGLDAKAVNDVKVNAILKADEHNANSLKMTAKVNELAKADVDSTSVKLVGIDVAVLDTDVKGSVGVNISGKNTIENKAEINADSDVTSDVSVSSASYGFATGSDTNLTSNINSNTVLNIGGELNAKEIEINSDTNKISKVDYSSSQGGGVSIGAATINNTVSGTSKVNLTDYQSSKDYDNNITIKNISTNTQDTVSSSSSGGGVSVSSASVSGSFGSSAEINVKNSDINAAGNLDFEVQNNNIVKDSASLTNGGVVAISTWDVSHTYGSSDKGAKITVDNSEISADNLDMKTFADTRNALGDGWVEYRGKSGGFWAEHTTTLTNTINQNSEIDVKNGSVLHADNNTTLIANTSSEFRQKIDSSGSGFVTIPKGQTTLNVNNTNKISIEAGSKVDSDNSTILNFDSDNTLYTRSYANSSHFAGDPTAKSYLNLVINNELQNNGVINAGNLIDINYMNNSQNELNQYARTVAEAAVATSTQDGKLSRTYNNSLNVAEGGLISSNKDVDINFGNGSEKLTSEISYKSVSRLAFGIPITATGNKENISRNGSSTLKLNGDIATGQGSNKYMKINSDGTVDTETLLGFASGNYSLSGDGTIDGEKLKAETLKLLNDKIKNLGSRIDSLNESIKEETKQISNLENQIKVNNDKLTEINNYTLKNIDEFNAVMDNDYKLLVRKALVNNGDVDGNNNVTVAYINIINDYKSYVLDMTENIPTITEFINSHDTYKNLTDTQKAIFQNNYDTVESKVTVSPKGNYTVYDSYMLSENVTITDGTAEGTSNITYANQKEYLTALNTTLTSYKNSYETSKTNEEVLISALTNEQTVLQNDYDTKKLQEANEFSEPYAIAFGDMASESSGINIAGITESNIKGSGNFKTAASALTIDNYSTRSLNFGAIDLASDTVSGLTISGKNYADYIGTDKVIGSETGVHYIVNGEGGNGDIKITNYYDNTNPFASSLENVPNNTTVSNITFQNRVKTGGNINIYNESGNITAQSGLSANKKIFTSVNGDVTIDNSDIDVTLKADDSIFAGGDVNIIANNADIKGDIKSGYTNRNLTITNDMLTNLVLDPTTGETNLINIEGTDNNIKAIYKDGEIYVFSLGNNGGKVNISANSGSVTSNVTAKDGYQTVSINNKTDKKLNVYNISNNNHSGGFTASDNLEVSNDKLTLNEVNQAQISISSENDGRISLNETVENSFNSFIADTNGILDIKSNNGIDFELNSNITAGGTVNIVNNSNGINIEGKITNKKGNILISNKDSDITIGEYDSENDNYINNENGNVNIDILNGNLLNGIVDKSENNNHSNYDLGNPDKSYKTLIASKGDLNINVTDGNIGTTSHDNPGFGIDSDTRDFTESINVNILGGVYAKALNNNNTDNRLVNIRAKDSDLNVKNITSDGNVILTAADWKQADENPAPENAEYFEGYSVLNANNNSAANITGQNISVIASNNIGEKDKKLVYKQDTLNAPDSSVNFEAEYGLYTTGKSNSDNEININQMVSKHGSMDIDLEANAMIKELTADGGLNITQKAQNLTIYSIGKMISDNSSYGEFDDILYPHDNIKLSSSNSDNIEALIPNYINIQVLDAIENPNRGNSNLKIFSAWVKGQHGQNLNYYSDGSRLADVTLMADNIYAGSSKAYTPIDSSYYPNNNYMAKSYSTEVFGDVNPVKIKAEGINAYGKGEELSIDILGVDKDIVDEIVANPQRNSYIQQNPIYKPAKFNNSTDRLYDYDYRVKNAVLSANDYAAGNRGVSVDTVYANNAFINTSDDNFRVEDAYIEHYAEFSNGGTGAKKAVVDNDYTRLLPVANLQLYTKETGSFNLGLNKTIDMKSSAPAVRKDDDKLLNGYHSAWITLDRGTKETQIALNNINNAVNRQIQLLNNNTLSAFNIASANNELEIIASANEDLDVIAAASKLNDGETNENEVKVSYKTSAPTFIVFDTMGELSGLSSDVKIYSISTTGAITSNEQGWSKGDNVSLNLTIDGLDVVIPAKVILINGSIAKLEFINMPRSLANKLLYKYMQANSEDMNLTVL